MTNRFLAVSTALILSLSLARAEDTNTAPAEATPPPAAPAPTTTTAPAPAETNAPAASTTTERPATYTMVAGDTLDSVAKKFNTSIHALAKLNKITRKQYRHLHPGQVLQIPPAESSSTK